MSKALLSLKRNRCRSAIEAVLLVERQDGRNQLGSAAPVVVVRVKVCERRRAVLINTVGVPIEGDLGTFNNVFPRLNVSAHFEGVFAPHRYPTCTRRVYQSIAPHW